jgi:hypothetical protein
MAIAVRPGEDCEADLGVVGSAQQTGSLGSAKKSLSGMALATGSGSAEEPAASALPLT